MLGILLVDKPTGMTSHDVVNEVRRRFRTKRVGHAGTLDPLATGVLVVAVGPATRFLQYLPLEPKEYVADIVFGASTDSYDREGVVTGTGTPPAMLSESVEEVLPEFRGLVQQIPPMFSALKFKGKPLYQLARNGQEVHRDPRTVHLSEVRIVEIEGPRVRLLVVCSGGTYVRSLAHDLGERLGCGAHLTELLRQAVGRFGLSDCTPLSDIKPELLMPLSQALSPMPMVALDADQVRQIREGRQIKIDCAPANHLVALTDPAGTVFSVARLLGNLLQPECVIPEEAVIDVV